MTQKVSADVSVGQSFGVQLASAPWPPLLRSLHVLLCPKRKCSRPKGALRVGCCLERLGLHWAWSAGDWSELPSACSQLRSDQGLGRASSTSGCAGTCIECYSETVTRLLLVVFVLFCGIPLVATAYLLSWTPPAMWNHPRAGLLNCGVSLVVNLQIQAAAPCSI